MIIYFDRNFMKGEEKQPMVVYVQERNGEERQGLGPKAKNENKVILKDGTDTEGRAEFRSRGGKPREGRQRGTEE